MLKLRTIKRIIKNPRLSITVLLRKGIGDWLDDAIFLKLLFYSQTGKKLNLDDPRSFNEKIQWLKIHDRNPEYIKWVDKKQAKEEVKRILGDQYVVPLIDYWYEAKDIQFDKLPSKCVLKCNHDQGSTRILDNTNANERKEVKKFLGLRLNKNPFLLTREWPYKYIKPCIICEEYLQDDIFDYKFFCFNGEPRFINVGSKEGEPSETHVTFLDLDWNPTCFRRNDYKAVSNLPPKPKNLDKMIEIARLLSIGTKFVRIDLFLVNDRIYFSEFTLYPTSGLIKFEPDEYDYIIGAWLDLNT